MQRSITEVDLSAAGRDAVLAAAAQFDLPYLTQCRESIRLLNQLTGPASVRKYLEDVVSTGSFEVVSPVSGRRLKSGSTFLPRSPALQHKSPTVFGFPDEPGLLIITDDVSLACPIVAAVLIDRPLVCKFVSAAWGVSTDDLPAILDLIRQGGWTPMPGDSRPVLVIGDENFAHSAWNQLPAIEQMLHVSHDLEVVETARPFGELGDFLPVRGPRRVATAELPSLCAPGARVLMAASLRVTASLAARIVDVSRLSLSGRSLAIHERFKRAPVLWLSVRTRNRVAINQADALFVIARHFLRTTPRGCIIIDGFSRAIEEVAWSNEIAAADKAEADRIADMIGHPNVHVAVGLNIRESIALGSLASAYFCPHGTIQHKVGWFNAVPGVVHANTGLLGMPNMSSWVKAQSEIALEPIYLPVEHVRDSGLGRGAYPELQHIVPQENYEFVDVDATASFFFKALASAC